MSQAVSEQRISRAYDCVVVGAGNGGLGAAAQLASYHTRKHGLLQGNMVGLGGLEKVRFRGVVRPGDRFVIVARLLKVRSTILTCEFQCFVRENLVCEGIIKGVALPDDLLSAGQSS